MSGICRAFVGHLSRICRAFVGHLSGICRAFVGHLSDICRAFVAHLDRHDGVMTASWPVVPAFLAGRSTRHSTPGPPGVRWRVERVERPLPKNLPIGFSPIATVSEKPADRIFANVRFYYLVSRGTCAIFTLASTRRRRMSGKQGFNRNNFNIRWPRCGHGMANQANQTPRGCI